MSFWMQTIRKLISIARGTYNACKFWMCRTSSSIHCQTKAWKYAYKNPTLDGGSPTHSVTMHIRSSPHDWSSRTGYWTLNSHNVNSTFAVNGWIMQSWSQLATRNLNAGCITSVWMRCANTSNRYCMTLGVSTLCILLNTDLSSSSKCSPSRTCNHRNKINFSYPQVVPTSCQSAEWDHQRVPSKHYRDPDSQHNFAELHQYISGSAIFAPSLHVCMCCQCLYCW